MPHGKAKIKLLLGNVYFTLVFKGISGWSLNISPYKNIKLWKRPDLRKQNQQKKRKSFDHAQTEKNTVNILPKTRFWNVFFVGGFFFRRVEAALKETSDKAKR